MASGVGTILPAYVVAADGGILLDVDGNGWYSPDNGDYFVGETYGTEACAPGAGQPGDLAARRVTGKGARTCAS